MVEYRFSLEKQVENYFLTLSRFKLGINQSRRLYLLSYLPEKARDRVILLPIFREHIDEIRELPYGNMESITPQLRERIISEARELYNRHRHSFARLELDWLKIAKQFTKLLFNQFPHLSQVPILISPTVFETLGGYEIKKDQIEIYPRFDRNISQVCQLLVNVATHYTYFSHQALIGESWVKKQAMVAQKFKEGGYESILEPYVGFLKVVNTHSVGKLVKSSIENYELIGFPIKPLLNSSEQIPGLTRKEQDVLDLLISNRREIVSFEKIGDCMWKENPDKYSLYAITKLVNRLRTKLRENNFPPYLIQTERGEGYILFD